MSSLEERLRDALEELELVRSGRPFHYHTDPVTNDRTRCSSPYCVDLTMTGIRTGPNA